MKTRRCRAAEWEAWNIQHAKSLPKSTPSPSISRSAPEPKGIMILRVVGVTYNGRQTVIARLKSDEQLILRREPMNPFDKNAIAVDRNSGEQIGYIDRYTAASLAPALDQLKSPKLVTVHRLYGAGGAYPMGVEIKFSLL